MEREGFPALSVSLSPSLSLSLSPSLSVSLSLPLSPSLSFSLSLSLSLPLTLSLSRTHTACAVWIDRLSQAEMYVYTAYTVCKEVYGVYRMDR